MDLQQMTSDLIACGWSQVRLAENVGCDQPMISRILNAQSPRTSKHIADGIGLLWAREVRDGKISIGGE